ncbi:hypothetical protein NCCP2222_07260 [Sporosarcina sp. NCCP-2222]|uniref:hypothetical protein n=1 Tax=Sporosarcina sp. NCCP-2222 TaxID=2935073 RepID=UPI00208B9C7F|nr:hypothetical protein [Sporosarcina sp. NCCP-2222]GKV54779.1 hypothetical protein NCCP2222_07260 [Sporosarcina sp. NCCP-2222]
MIWKYIQFEGKLLLRNKLNWLLGVAFILFFPLYFIQYSDSDVESLRDKKSAESLEYNTIFNFFPEEMRDTPEGQEIYNNLTEQSSMISKQRFSLWKKADYEEYIEGGLRLNELRLRLHELGNKGVHPEFVVPKEEIMKEDALLRYYQKNQLPLEADPFTTSNYLPVALEKVNGLLFVLFVLFMGGNMLLHDQQKRTVMGIFPISFMQRVFVKTGLHFVQVLVFLLAGLLIGGWVVAAQTAWGDFKSPLLLFQNGDYVAVSTSRYILYMVVAMALLALLLLFASILVNVITKNMYATVLLILVVFLAPMLLHFAGINASLLQPLSVMDISQVLTGDVATQYGKDTMDYKWALIWLCVLNMALIAVLFGGNRVVYMKKHATPTYQVGKGGNN